MHFRRFLQRICLLLIGILALTSLSGCFGKSATSLPADYGKSGSEAALVLATKFPYRSPSSEQEKQAAAWVAAQFTALGYKATIVPFKYKDSKGQEVSSQNVVAELKGRGFKYTTQGDASKIEGRWIIVGANYDAVISASAAAGQKSGLKTENGETGTPTLADFNGIHNNASGLATMLTVAKAMKTDAPGYDVQFVAFGAGTAGASGATAHLATIAADKKAKLDAMYNISGIYAGDKVYASAGQNSVVDEKTKNYNKRRKLYEATDVYYSYTLQTQNAFSLYTNQASFALETDIFGKKTKTIYREWTTRQSDHTPFDIAGVPIVFFESGDYVGTSLEEMAHESKNPIFQDTKGLISSTPNDSSVFLDRVFNDKMNLGIAQTTTVASSANAKATTAVIKEKVDRLTQRINNVAFIIVKAAQRGADDTEMR